MKSINVSDYLNKDNIWVGRLINDTFKVKRSIDKVISEYNDDKYYI